jgi:phosphotransferase system, enzyme I, PtsP
MPAVARQRDNIDLVWSITELSSLFERRTNTAEFLQAVADRVATHLESDVCSIYLLDEEEQTLTLRATRGLEPGSVGQVSLALGEGITGTAVQELRPIREARGTHNPSFKLIPQMNEEEYQSFLAVPIRRGLNRIGALVVQHKRPDYFTSHDTRALQAIAAQLAATLENVEMIMELRHHGSEPPTRPRLAPEAGRGERLPCRPASEGVAVGRLTHLRYHEAWSHHWEADASHENHDQEALFQAALDRTIAQLESIHAHLDNRLADVAGLIFGTHLLMLKDDEFSGEMLDAIRGGRQAQDAVREVTERYVSLLSSSQNPRTREKSQDIRDLGTRLLRNLQPDAEDAADLRGRVVIAHEMFPSDLVRMAAEHAEGVILTGGGPTAHITILARSLEIPAVFLPEAEEATLAEDDLVVVDAYEGWIHPAPPETVLEQYRAAAGRHPDLQTDQPRTAPTTADGVAVELLANVNILHDAEIATRAGAAGIGLYRSEFPFLLRHDFPSENEQCAVYRKIVERVPDGPVVLRTLDIGGDKLFSEAQHLEGNPFLGLRGIRFSLAHPDLLTEQLRAMLRAGADRDLGILFPMISSVDEFRSAAGYVRRAGEELTTEDLPHCEHPRLGVMIELPSAVELAAAFAGEADFLSIGSNDLVMYLLGVDRTNEQVGSLYQPFHPAVLSAFKRVIQAATARNCPVSICGEAGGEPRMLRFLIGAGLRSISAEPAKLPGIRRRIAQLDIESAQAYSAALLACTTLTEVQDLLAAGGRSRGKQDHPAG